MVKQANDIVEVVGEYLSLKKQGRTYKGLCPFHDDHNPSMDVNQTRQTFRCWVCGKFGDVITFVMEREHLEFREALELLAKRANIELRRSGNVEEASQRTRMLDVMKWAEGEYHRFLQEAPGAAEARAYVVGRRLNEETIKKYALGFAPGSFTWLTQRGQQAGWNVDLLVDVGLTARRDADGSPYDRFRDRVMFPIRDGRGRTVGFGGRILPNSSSSANAPKYYNSSDTPLFTKSEHLYGLDQARAAADKEGFLAVVEGYTDVLMAHQAGVLPVVATLGTALNERHVKQLKRFVPRVVLVFDADAGGESGVDRALEVFVSEDVELAIATLPDGMDPCDLIVARGPEPFRAALASAVDALEFKLNRALTPAALGSVEGRRRAVDAVLGVLAAAPELPGSSGQMKRELVISRIATRAQIPEEVVRRRLNELRQERPQRDVARGEPQPDVATEVKHAPADPCERQLVEILLAEPPLVEQAMPSVGVHEIHHLGLRRILEEMYTLWQLGKVPEVDRLREALQDKRQLADFLLKMHAVGMDVPNRAATLRELLVAFEERRVRMEMEEVRGRLRAWPADAGVPRDLLQQLQQIEQRLRQLRKPST